MVLKLSQSENILGEPFSVRKYGSDKIKNTSLESVDFAEYFFKEEEKGRNYNVKMSYYRLF